MFARRYLVILCLATSILSPQRADAAGEASQFQDGTAISAGVQSTDDSGNGGSSGHYKASDIKCTYVALTPDQVAFINQNADASTLNGGDGSLNSYNVICSDPNNNIVNVDNYQAPTAADPVALAEQAFDYRKLPLPAITLNPPVTSPQLVNLSTWLSVGSQTWQPVTASASQAGVTSTVVATPTSVVWSTGDGATVTCTDAGAVFNTALPVAAQRSDCTHTFAQSSAGQPGGTFTLSAAVTWTVQWTATGLPAGQPATGNLNDVVRTSTTQIAVVEAEALNQSS